MENIIVKVQPLYITYPTLTASKQFLKNYLLKVKKNYPVDNCVISSKYQNTPSDTNSHAASQEIPYLL
jgi:hypothetical protein